MLVIQREHSLPAQGEKQGGAPWRHCLRHFRPSGSAARTSISLESAWWGQIDQLAEKSGSTWQQWARQQLASKPSGVGVAAWLRLSVMTASGVGVQ